MDLLKFKETCDLAYDTGIPLITDTQYDNLFGESATIGRTGYRDDITHAFPLWSLQKYYPEDGETPLNINMCVATPKLDGNAVCVLYINGKFSRASTRGNGVAGKDVTNKVATLVPPYIDTYFPILQVNGEVVASKDVDNSRNQVAGLLGLKYQVDFVVRSTEIGVRFVAYSVSNNRYTSYLDDLEYLQEEGFLVVTDSDLECSFPTDGVVYRINDNSKFEEMGYTSKHPRGAFAWKEKQEAVTTTLLDVIWQVGKSGKVTPVAILDPVVIGEATVAKATLNNMAFINALDLEIGCSVNVIRAGEIIPEIVSRNY